MAWPVRRSRTIVCSSRKWYPAAVTAARPSLLSSQAGAQNPSGSTPSVSASVCRADRAAAWAAAAGRLRNSAAPPASQAPRQRVPSEPRKAPCARWVQPCATISLPAATSVRSRRHRSSSSASGQRPAASIARDYFEHARSDGSPIQLVQQPAHTGCKRRRYVMHGHDEQAPGGWYGDAGHQQSLHPSAAATRSLLCASAPSAIIGLSWHGILGRRQVGGQPPPRALS